MEYPGENTSISDVTMGMEGIIVEGTHASMLSVLVTDKKGLIYIERRLHTVPSSSWYKRGCTITMN